MQTSHVLQAEDRLVVELAQLVVHYLSRQDPDAAWLLRPPHELLAELVRQPSSRVRLAVIALMLARPDYAEHIPQALQGLESKDAQTLRFFYLAAVKLQAQDGQFLHTVMDPSWRKLPDLFSDQLGGTGDSPEACLKRRAHLQARWSGQQLNWAGTYKNAVQHLLRHWELENVWIASVN